MLHLSRFVPDQGRFSEFLACLWQGPVPESLELREYVYVEGEPTAMCLLWSGDGAATAYMEQAFGGFGSFTTEVVTDATAGLAAAFARDLDAFGRLLAERGMPAAEIDAALDVRRRGMESMSQEQAAAAGRAWEQERAPGRP